jgi:hypothetical protein
LLALSSWNHTNLERVSIHVEGRKGETLGVRCAIHLKKLLSLATPSLRIFPVETQEFQYDSFGFKALLEMGAFQKGMGLNAKADGGRVRRVWLRILEGLSVWRVGFSVLDRLFF